MKRGDLVTVALSGTYGKPRPALVIQADYFDEHPSTTLLPVTSHLVEAPLFRVKLGPSETSGLHKPSQIMIDKAVTVPRERIGEVIGHLDTKTLLEVERCLAVFFGIAS